MRDDVAQLWEQVKENGGDSDGIRKARVIHVKGLDVTVGVPATRSFSRKYGFEVRGVEGERYLLQFSAAPNEVCQPAKRGP